MRLCEFFSGSESWDIRGILRDKARELAALSTHAGGEVLGGTSWPIVRIGTVLPVNSS
jgi:hypothetical protein